MVSFATESDMPPAPPAAIGTAITIAAGDGIGPEILDATLKVLGAAGAKLNPEYIEVGAAVYGRGVTSGITKDSWESLRRTRVLLKGPIATPQGGGVKSLNVTIRKTLGMFANVRPCIAYHPFVPTRHPSMDVVVIRENEEDVYAGIEHRQTDEVVQCLKLISVPGTERIVRYAFEYARRMGRRKVTCMTKDNIMKMTDGLFHRVFNEVAAAYPDLEREHMIVDIGAAKLAVHPERFDVVVLPNLYGDILSDVAAELAGSIGLAGSANVGEHVAMFEAIHGTAPALAGRDQANPSGLILASVMMLTHIGQPDVAARVHNAWLTTIENGVGTADIYSPETSTRLVGTRQFADAVIARLGEMPHVMRPATYAAQANVTRAAVPTRPAAPSRKTLKGVDVFVHFREPQPAALAEALRGTAGPGFFLEMITNRGVRVWPNGHAETSCTDHWRCRFMAGPDADSAAPAAVVQLLGRLVERRIDVIKTENLYDFDGVRGYSLGQGQ